MRSNEFALTAPAVAAALTPPGNPGTVRMYADAGLVECLRLGNGVRLFRPSAVAQVEQLRKAGLAKRGGRRVAAA